MAFCFLALHVYLWVLKEKLLSDEGRATWQTKEKETREDVKLKKRAT